MKVCEKCGVEIFTMDGDNFCQSCADMERFKKQKAANAKRMRLMREEALRSCGLKKVRGALGGTYWE